MVVDAFYISLALCIYRLGDFSGGFALFVFLEMGVLMMMDVLDDVSLES
jgi:hypothetical protein